MNRQLKKQIQTILIMLDSTRNNDRELYKELIELFYPQFIHKFLWFKYIKLDDLINLPNYANVVRLRALFNAKWLYLPTDPKVLKQRLKYAKEVRKFINNI